MSALYHREDGLTQPFEEGDLNMLVREVERRMNLPVGQAQNGYIICSCLKPMRDVFDLIKVGISVPPASGLSPRVERALISESLRESDSLDKVLAKFAKSWSSFSSFIFAERDGDVVWPIIDRPSRDTVDRYKKTARFEHPGKFFNEWCPVSDLLNQLHTHVQRRHYSPQLL
jgi:hypothetical protein